MQPRNRRIVGGESQLSPGRQFASNRLLTLPEVCRLLGIGRSHLYRLINRDLIPVIRLGRSVRIREQALSEVLDRLAAEQAAESDDLPGIRGFERVR